MIVQAKTTADLHPALTPGGQYHVIGIEADDLRILDDSGEPCLYSPDFFDVMDATEPADWMSTTGEDGERYAYPPALNATGFFGDYFDGDAKVRAAFWQTVNRHLAAAS